MPMSTMNIIITSKLTLLQPQLADFSKYTCNLTVDCEELLDYIQVKETLHMTVTHSTL